MHRRDFIRTASLGATLLGLRAERAHALDAAPPIPRPSPAQLAWQQDELAMFIHFGVNKIGRASCRERVYSSV